MGSDVVSSTTTKREDESSEGKENGLSYQKTESKELLTLLLGRQQFDLH